MTEDEKLVVEQANKPANDKNAVLKKINAAFTNAQNAVEDIPDDSVRKQIAVTWLEAALMTALAAAEGQDNPMDFSEMVRNSSKTRPAPGRSGSTPARNRTDGSMGPSNRPDESNQGGGNASQAGRNRRGP